MTILVAEDEIITAMWLQAELKTRGYTILSLCSRGQQVIESARNDQPDLLLLDIHLQDDVDGIAAAAAIGNVPIIYASAYVDDETLARAQATNPIAILEKPLDITELVSIIENSALNNS